MQDWLENGPFEWIGGSASHNVGYIALYMWHISDMLYCGLTVMRLRRMTAWPSGIMRKRKKTVAGGGLFS